MAQARITYGADGDYVDKQLKEFTLTQEVIEKLDSIEPGAERNFIQGIKVNGEPQTPDEFRVVNINVPEVEDSLTSTDIRKALSAKQGKVLMDYIKNLQALGHFLSNWNATTGMPTTNPQEMPYTYNAGDYYIISIIGNTNYRPEGSVYNGSASSTLETEDLQVGDLYMYDGTEWLFLLNNERKIPIDTSLSTTSINPVENRVITNALNTKQETLTAGNNIQLNGNVISATDTTYDNLPASQGGADESLVTTGDKYNWNNKQDTLQAGANIQITGNTISATDTVYGAGANIQINNNIISATDTTYTAQDFDIKDLSDSTDKRTYWDNKQEKIIAGTNVTIDADGKTINATDTTYTAGANISIDANNVISAVDTTYTAGQGIDITNGVISNTQTSAEWGNIQGDIADQTDLQNALDEKQNTISDLSTIRSNASAGANAANTISTYGNIVTHNVNEFATSAQGGKADTALQPLDNISELNNDAGYITSASLPTVNDGTLTINQNGTSKGTFTANQSGNSTINLTDTTYTASDFDIKDLADSDDLRTVWDGKQNAIADLQTIRDGAALGATALQSGDNISELNNDAGYITSASLPTVNNGTLTIQKNGTNVATFTANQSGNSTANLVIPTTASDVDALPDTTKYGANLDLSLDSTNYKITVTLKDQDGNTLGTAKTIDLPIESVVIGGSYDSTTKEVVLTLQGGSTIRFSVADLVAGLQSEITSTNKLSADLVDDTSTSHKFVSTTEKNTWNAKQDAISDLTTIRSGAALGATALQSGDNVSELTNDAGYITSSYHDSTKQDVMSAGNLITIDSNKIKNDALFVIKESDVTVTTSEDTGVDPYNASYKYTNITLNNTNVKFVEGALYTFIVDTSMVVASAYRNVRVRLGSSGTWIPVMNTSSILPGHSYFTKANIRYFQYTTKYQSGGALHMITDTNTTYSGMTAAEITAGTSTTNRLISPANLKTAIQTWNEVQSVNGKTGVVTVTEANDSTITYTQAGDTIGSTTTNQASASTVAFRGDIFVTQAEYTALPSTKLTDGNTYLIYE